MRGCGLGSRSSFERGLPWVIQEAKRGGIVLRALREDAVLRLLAAVLVWPGIGGTTFPSVETLAALAVGALIVILTALGVHRLRAAERARELEARRAREELEKSRDQLEAIVQVVGDGITIHDAAGRLVRANAAAARTLGYTSVHALLETLPHDMLQKVEILEESGQPFPLDHLLGRTLQGGEQRAVTLLHLRLKETGEERWSVVKAQPVVDSHGQVQYAITTFHDITEQRRTEVARRFLTEASQLLAAALDYPSTLTSIARLAVPVLADWCSVHVVEEDGSLRCLAVAHADPAKVEMVRELQRRHPPGLGAWHGISAVVLTHRSEIYSEVPDVPLDASTGDEEYLRIRRALGPRSAMIVPLLARGRTLGVITFAAAESGRRYGPTDLALAEELARRAALAVDSVRLSGRNHHVAETLQRVFLPAALPQLPGVKLDAAYLFGAAAPEVGGDWYDAFQLPDGRVALSIGDVTGCELHAAAAMGQVRQAIRAAAFDNNPIPSEVLGRAARLFHLAAGGRGIATAVFSILDPVSRTFTYATAGHPPPVLARADGQVEILATGGLPLGGRTVSISPVWTVPFPIGALLVLYTDGLVEHTRNLLDGESTLIRAVRAELEAPSGNPAKAIQERVLTGGRPPDDVAILTVSLTSMLVDRFELTVPADPSVLQQVRHAIRRFASEVGVDAERSEALQVAVGEAMNNAIEHAYLSTPGTVHVRARRDGAALVVEIEDHGRWRSARAEPQGHGLVLMRALMDSVQVVTTAAGTTVRLMLSLAEGSEFARDRGA